MTRTFIGGLVGLSAGFVALWSLIVSPTLADLHYRDAVADYLGGVQEGSDLRRTYSRKNGNGTIPPVRVSSGRDSYAIMSSGRSRAVGADRRPPYTSTPALAAAMRRSSFTSMLVGHPRRICPSSPFKSWSSSRPLLDPRESGRLPGSPPGAESPRRLPPSRAAHNGRRSG